MRQFENQTFDSDIFRDRDSAALFSELAFRSCHFEGCALSVASQPALRSRVRHVNMTGCSQRGCFLGAAILEDVVVDGLETSGQLLQAWGAVFRRVVLRGKIDRIMISNEPLPDLSVNEPYQNENVEAFVSANAAFYQDVDWALDVSDGDFRELDIRGVPVNLIRRDPETQMILTRQKALQGDWSRLKLRETLWSTWVRHFLSTDELATLLVAPKRHPKFHNLLADLNMLKAAGVTEAD